VPARDPDEPLVRRAQRGDAFAFERLVDRHQHRLFTLAARLTGSRDDAADVVQEAFVRAWTGLSRFRGQSLFSTWLYRICANAAHDERERRRAVPADVDATVPDARDRFADRELGSALQAALDALEEPYRTVLVLHDVLGCPYGEIAEIVGVAEGTVKSRLFRGRTELARRLGTHGAATESNR
jgi:RNA polymerase sigma factor (sigma-70 family)